MIRQSPRESEKANYSRLWGFLGKFERIANSKNKFISELCYTGSDYETLYLLGLKRIVFNVLILLAGSSNLLTLSMTTNIGNCVPTGE